MNYAIIIVSAIIFSFLDYLFIQYKSVISENKKISMVGIIPHGWKQIACFTLIPISLFGLAFMMNLFYAKSILYTLKRVCVIALLWPAAYSDYREYRIPNKLILFWSCIRVLLLIVEFIALHGNVLATFVSEICAIVGSAIVCFACMFLSRGSLGMGDLKLLMVMAAFLGVEGICYTMFVSIFFAAIISIGLLIFKRKSRKDKIPFAPFVLTGTLVCLILAGV